MLITGANSYVGTNVEKWLMREPDKYYVETLDMKEPNWKDFDFTGFDVVFHVAGIVHIRESRKTKELIFNVNYKLAVEVAEKAKREMIKQFIYMSTLSVYSRRTALIDKNTIPKPDSFYGQSKLLAENSIRELFDKEKGLTIIRPPMIYGINSPGNFKHLVFIAQKMKIFIKTYNNKSLLFIENFCSFLEYALNQNLNGIYHPNDVFNYRPSDIIDRISRKFSKKIIFIPGVSLIFKLIPIRILSKFLSTQLISSDIDKVDYSNILLYSGEETIERCV